MAIFCSVRIYNNRAISFDQRDDAKSTAAQGKPFPRRYIFTLD